MKPITAKFAGHCRCGEPACRRERYPVGSPIIRESDGLWVLAEHASEGLDERYSPTRAGVLAGAPITAIRAPVPVELLDFWG